VRREGGDTHAPGEITEARVVIGIQKRGNIRWLGPRSLARRDLSCEWIRGRGQKKGTRPAARVTFLLFSTARTPNSGTKSRDLRTKVIIATDPSGGGLKGSNQKNMLRLAGRDLVYRATSPGKRARKRSRQISKKRESNDVGPHGRADAGWTALESGPEPSWQGGLGARQEAPGRISAFTGVRYPAGKCPKAGMDGASFQNPSMRAGLAEALVLFRRSAPRE